jgi:hypothetical protein
MFSSTPSTPRYSSNFDAVKKLPRANLHEVNGWKFIEHVSLQSDLNSSTAKDGDAVWGLLLDDCKWGGKLVAAKDSLIKGHLQRVESSRTLLHASLSRDRRYHSNASFSIQFDEIVDQDGKNWPIDGKLSHITQESAGSPGVPPRMVEVDKKGNVIRGGAALTDNEKTAIAVTRVATTVPIPVSMVANVVGIPAVMGAVGAIHPSIVYNKPVDVKAKNARAKAFVYGFVTNLPGASVVAACVQKGDAVELKNGDEIIVEMVVKDSAYSPPAQKLSVSGAVVK